MVLVLPRLHLEDVGDDAVDLDVADEAGEEEVLEGVGVEGAEGGEEEEEAGEPVPLAGVPGGGVLPQLAHHLVLQPLHGVVVCKSRVSGAFYLATYGRTLLFENTQDLCHPGVLHCFFLYLYTLRIFPQVLK